MDRVTKCGTRSRLALLVACIISMTQLSCGGLNSKDKLVVSVNSWVGFGPIFIALENGFFAQEGLRIEVVRTENAPDRRAALKAGRVDIVGSTLDDLAVTLGAGVDAVAIQCADHSNGSDGIIVSERIRTLADLVGEPIAVQPGFVNHFFLLYVLSANGLASTGLSLQPMTPDDAGAAFMAGRIDAAVTWEPHLTRGLEVRKGSHVIATSREYPEAILDLFICQRDLFERAPQTTAAFQRAWDRAVAYCRSNPTEAATLIGAAIGFSTEATAEMLAGVAFLNSEEGKEFLAPRLEKMAENTVRVWRSAGFVQGEVGLADALAPLMVGTGR